MTYENLAAPALSTVRQRDLPAYCAVIFIALAGNASVSLKPILIGSYVEFLKYSAANAGYTLAAEATAMSLGTALAALFVGRWNRRRMVIVALIMIALGNLLSIFTHSMAALAVIRAFTGLGHGVALAVAAASIACFRQPDRMAGVVTVAVSALGMSLMFFVPWAQHSERIAPLFWTMGSMVLPPLLFLGAIPQGLKSAHRSLEFEPGYKKEASAGPSPIIVITLIAVGFFYISVGSFWPFAEQLGRNAGLSYEDASRVTAFAAMAAIFGALTAIALGDRFGRMLPIGGSISVAIAGLSLLLSFPKDPTIFSVVVIAYMFCWATLYPFLLGFASQLDPSGRVNGLVFSLSLIGLAIGPGLASAVISIGMPAGGSNLTNLVWMSVICLLPSFALVYAIRKQGIHRQPENAHSVF